ncbi:glycosyltransferase family 4 protein [Ewingella sp. CoE-038-23]|uniref:glycosyltransferase family 4 protein n=1 Tax=Ewingella docleensis TaxID=3118588 RepID=UPI0033656828
MKKVLYVTGRFPFPLITGDALRAYNQIKHIAEDHYVDVFSIEPVSIKSDEITNITRNIYSANVGRLQKAFNIIFNFYDRPLQSAMYVDSSAWKILSKIITNNDYDIVIFQLVRLEWYVKKTASLRNKRELNFEIYCDYVDALSLNMQNRANSEKTLKKLVCRRESKQLVKCEREIFPLVDKQIIISQRDADYINAGYFHIVPNGVNLPKEHILKKIESADNKTINIVFFGNMGYYPNVKAAILLAEIFQSLPKNKFQLHIVGANPAKKIMSLDEVPGIKVYGYVENLQDLLTSMDVAVFPILDGSGLQNKVLEAFSLQIPVITTSIVMASIISSKNCTIIANSKEEFIDAIEKFSRNEFPTESIVENAYELIKKEYSWNKINHLM